MSKTCSVEGCNGKHYAKGMCHRHWKQMKDYGQIRGNITYSRLDKNTVIKYDDYAEIILRDTLGNEIARALIDLDDVEHCEGRKWTYHENYVVWHNGRKLIKLHRFLLGLDEFSCDEVIDHINGNPLDNRKSNLRVCTQQQNMCNRKKSKGYCYDKTRDRWIVYIELNGKRISRRVKTEEEAKQLRLQWEQEYFGEYAPKRED